MNTDYERKVASWRTRCALVGGAALVASLAGGWFEARQFFPAYLYAYLFWVGLSVGCAVITMIHHLTGGKWGHPVRRFLETGAATMPIMAILFVPIVFGLQELYPWARSDLDKELLKKAAYLNPAFFIARTVLYFLIWSALLWRLRRISLEQDRTGSPQPSRRLLSVSGPGVIILTLTATFAYIDWIMSLEPKWHSTVFPIILLAGQILVGFCFCALLLKVFNMEKSMANASHFHALGNLILTFVLFWAYLVFSQLLIIYSGNKPDEISWYLRRIAGGWKIVILVVAGLHFFLPFLLLLFRSFKRSLGALASLTGLLAAVHLVYCYWIVKPAFPSLSVSWMDFTTPLAIGGIWCASFLWLLEGEALVPINDQRIKEELAYAEA